MRIELTANFVKLICSEINKIYLWKFVKILLYYVHEFVHNSLKAKTMLTATISEFRRNMKKYFDSIDENFETLIVNRSKDKGIVVMSLEEYNSLLATQLELSSATNIERLDSALAKFKKGKSFEKKLIDE